MFLLFIIKNCNYLDGHYSLMLNVINYELLLSRIRFQDLDELKVNTDFLDFMIVYFLLI